MRTTQRNKKKQEQKEEKRRKVSNRKKKTNNIKREGKKTKLCTSQDKIEDRKKNIELIENRMIKVCDKRQRRNHIQILEKKAK